MTDTPKPVALIVAMAKDRVIGRDGGLPWHHAEDLKFFRRTTMGHAIVMGRKTWESLGRALPGRRNLVVSRDTALTAEGAEVFPSLEAALDAARTTDSLPFVIGGAQLYEAALPVCTHMFVTEVPGAPEGDTRFPAWNVDAWREVERTAGETDGLFFVRYERRNARR
ncbi:MAG: dihydrofolate reductase [Polyangiales bacterium]|nr:dihydrofolate reductase [Myxococcales bacterium]